ncbi:glycosyltransferase family 2 protein [Vibrio breoganii]
MNNIVSIVIPAFNAEKYIIPCVESCLNQTHSNIKVIVVNDGSTDQTEKKLLEVDDERLEIISSENNGVCKARQLGLDKVNSEFVFFLDSDDKLAINAIEILLHSIKVNKCDVAVGQSYSFFENEFAGYKYRSNIYNDSLSSIENFLVRNLPVTLWPTLYNVKTIRNINLDLDLIVGEDYVINAQIYIDNIKVCCVDELVHKYRRHNQSTTAKISLEKYRDNYRSYTMVLDILNSRDLTNSEKDALEYHKAQYLFSLISINSPYAFELSKELEMSILLKSIYFRNRIKLSQKIVILLGIKSPMLTKIMSFAFLKVRLIKKIWGKK